MRAPGIEFPIWTLERILQLSWDSSSKPPSDGARVSRPVGGRIGGLSGEDALELIMLPPSDSIMAILRSIETLITLLSQLVSSSQLTPKLLSSNCKVILSFYRLTTISSYHVINPYGISSDCPHLFGQMAESFLDNCSNILSNRITKVSQEHRLWTETLPVCQDNPLLAEPDQSSNLFQVSSPRRQLYTGARGGDVRRLVHMRRVAIR